MEQAAYDSAIKIMSPPPNLHSAENRSRSKTDYSLLVRNAWCAAAAESLFTILPLLILSMVLGYQGRLGALHSSPEWSFAAAVLFGQSVVKLVSALAESGGAHAERMGLVVAAVLVLGLCPSLATLMLLMIGPDPGLILSIVQLCLCGLGFLALFFASTFAALSRVSSHPGKGPGA